MTTEKIKVNIDFFQSQLQLFVTATVEKIKHNEPLIGIQEEYVSNIQLIQLLAEQCLIELQDDDPWYLVFVIIKKEADNLYRTFLNQFPVYDHVHVLESLASIYNACVGVELKMFDFFRGGYATIT